LIRNGVGERDRVVLQHLIDHGDSTDPSAASVVNINRGACQCAEGVVVQRRGATSN
jgi:hypothetical protein